ncbi:peroxiredoxin [Pedobacter sp. L105]|uniref:peroxiredoxin family protein n=1 Tax=Pedobacter sp. L105 TaxID=1641871 RepID=UPI00131B9520|nr:TlpA disulfide reductase family protein [Pedobacter sp. L105]
MNLKKLIKLLICLGSILSSLNANAQVVILQSTVDKLESYKNFSYQYVYKLKEAFGDTSIFNSKFLLLKTPEEKELGYVFRLESSFGDMKVPSIEQYDGKKFTALYPKDSTYYTSQRKNAQAEDFSRSLPGELNYMKTFSKEHPAKLIQSADTIINSINCYHLVFNTMDTIVNKDHLYVRRHLFINKVTDLPVGIVIRARSSGYGKEVTNYYADEFYFNYKMDQDNVNLAYFAIPEEFHPAKQKPNEQVVLLASGKVAPDFTLYDSDGKKTSLSQFKGKIVLLDFFFVGCGACMQTLAPLDKLDKKYKNKNFVILSISDRDSKKLVTEFKESQHISNQVYPNGGDVAKLYHMTAGPTFYFIDQEGKISSAFIGVADNFEEKMSVIIDNLIKKS